MVHRRAVRRVLLSTLGAVAVALGLWWGPFAAFHLLPPDWTGEADRLAAALGVQNGTYLGEVGAGSGAMALAMARRVGPGGRVYATELSEPRRRQIAASATGAGASNVVVVVARPHATGLEAECCEAIFMRNVFHHVDGPELALQLRRCLRPGGRLAVIDFAPGRLAWHLGPDHGASSDQVIQTFGDAGFRLLAHDPDWGGGTYMLLFELGS